MYCSSIGVSRDFLIKMYLKILFSDVDVREGIHLHAFDSKELSVKGLKHFGNNQLYLNANVDPRINLNVNNDLVQMYY